MKKYIYMNNDLSKLFKYTVLIIIISTGISFSQLESNNVVQFTEKDGVPGSQVGTILSDKFGYIWIGTINGLARYDGYEFKRFYNDPNDPASIKGLIVWSLFEDRKGQIWVSTSPENLNVYNPGTKSFRQYEYKHLIERPANVEIGITSICENDNGRIYFGISSYQGERISSALLYLDEKENKIKKFVSPDGLVIQNIMSLTKDKSGNVWIISWNGLFKIDSSGMLSKIQFLDEEMAQNNEYATDVKSDKQGHIWLITNKSRLFDLDAQTGKYKSYYQKEFDKSSYSQYNRQNKIVFDKNENLWIGSSKGLHYFEREKEKFVGFNDPSKNLLEDADILDLKFDSFGSLWIGTLSGGLFKYEERALLKSYSFNLVDKNSLTPGWANHIYESNDGKIWITTSGQTKSGINVFDLKSGSIKPMPFQNFLPGSAIIFGLFEKSPNEFLLSTVLGLFQFSSNTNEVKQITFNGVPPSVFIYQFVKDRYENFWLCTSDGLYKKRKDTETFKRYDLMLVKGSNASSNEITSAFESKKHGLWLLTPNGLFLHNYSSDKIERHGFDKTNGDIFISQDFNSFYEDSSGNLWVGTWQGGLSNYNVATKKIKTFTRNDGLPSMSVQGILGDEENNVLWLSTFDGLSRFDIMKEQFNNFSIADGIQSQLFADGSCLKTSQGLFIFGGSNGITLFRGNDINKNTIPPKVFLSDLKLFNKSVIPGDNSILEKPIYETKEIVMEYDQNNISLEFIVIHYSNPNKNNAAYKLENYENEWREVGNQHSAFYPNLPPGKYVFRVKAANNNGVWNEEGASLRIIIYPPWWKTTTAYVGYFFLFAGIVFGIDRVQRRRILYKERNAAAIKEANLRAQLAETENERKTKELEEARQLQLSMLPKVLPQLPHLDIAVYMKTATEVGGDYYDFNVALDGTLTIVLGDATGHGMRAGTMVTSAKSLFNSYAANPDILFTFREMTRCIKQMQFQSLAMSMMMLKIQNNKLLMSSAGMPPAYIFRKKNKTVEEHLIEGMPLGTMDNFPYELKEMELFSGDTILLMSDGFPELQNKDNEMLGYKRAKNSFEETAEKDPEKIISYLNEVSSRWLNSKEQEDDITFVVIKVK